MQMTLWCLSCVFFCVVVWIFKILFPLCCTQMYLQSPIKGTFTLKRTCGGNPKGQKQEGEINHDRWIWTNCVNLVLLLKCEPPLRERRESSPPEAVSPSCHRKLDGLGGKHSRFRPSLPTFSPAPELKQQPQNLNCPYPVARQAESSK